MRRNLYLGLSIACFLSVIALYFFDGYMGLYDTLTLNAGKYEQKVELYQWLWGGGAYPADIRWGEKGFFHYEVDNRQFSTYSADVEVSVWHGGEKMRDLLSQHISVGAFDKVGLEWTLDTVELESCAPKEYSYYEYAVIISRGEAERKLRFYIRS